MILGFGGAAVNLHADLTEKLRAEYGILAFDKATEFLSRARDIIYDDLADMLQKDTVCYVHEEVKRRELRS